VAVESPEGHAAGEVVVVVAADTVLVEHLPLGVRVRESIEGVIQERATANDDRAYRGDEPRPVLHAIRIPHFRATL
jgi:hypothetical protein